MTTKISDFKYAGYRFASGALFIPSILVYAFANAVKPISEKPINLFKKIEDRFIDNIINSCPMRDDGHTDYSSWVYKAESEIVTSGFVSSLIGAVFLACQLVPNKTPEPPSAPQDKTVMQRQTANTIPVNIKSFS